MGYKDSEKQKEYNKKYYSENKQKIEEMIGKKEPCPYCGRSVRHQNMMKHLTTKYCETRRIFNNKLQDEKIAI